jgi:exosortase/archaeosortase family protein
MARRIASFVAVFALLWWGYESARGTAVERFVVDRMTVATAASLLDALDPSLGVRAVGSRLAAPGGGLNVLAGCEGVDMLLLLVAAFAAAPLPLRGRLVGLALGVAGVFALNQLRIVALFLANRADRELFALLHGTVAPLAMIAAVAVFFALWIGRHGEPLGHAHAPGGDAGRRDER